MDHPPALTISAFARFVGLAPSALRFYDDCGVLKPAHVDGTSGCRYYAQSSSAARPAPAEFADRGPAADRGRHRARRRAGTSARAVGGAPAPDPPGGRSRRCRARPGVAQAGRKLRAGVRTRIGRRDRQVVPSASDNELAIRVLRPEAGSGALLVPAAGLAAIGRRVARLPQVDIDFGRRRIDTVTLSTIDEEYPDYREVLDGLGSSGHRIVVDRLALREALGTEPHPLHVGRDELRFGDRKIPAARKPHWLPASRCSVRHSSRVSDRRCCLSSWANYGRHGRPFRGRRFLHHARHARETPRREVVNPDNPVVRLCGQAWRRRHATAAPMPGACFGQAWDRATDDYGASMTAHYLARNQPYPKKPALEPAMPRPRRPGRR
jgi:hypothetical protein